MANFFISYPMDTMNRKRIFLPLITYKTYLNDKIKRYLLRMLFF